MRRFLRILWFCLCLCFLGSSKAMAAVRPVLVATPISLQWLVDFVPALRGSIERHREPQWVDARHYGGNVLADANDAKGPELHVVVISDLNGSYGSTDYREDVHRAVKAIIERRPDVVISTGDMVAGQRAGLDYRAMWQGFHDAVTIPLQEAGIPLLITPGNHDGAGTPRFAYERAIFEDEWQIHRPKVTFLDDQFYPARYSVVMGPTLFISLDATTVGALSSEQMRWLETQLQHASDFATTVVFGHVPLYAVAYNKEREIIGDPALEALFNRYGVDAYISGHHHTYYPGARGELRLVAMPCLGSGLRRLVAAEQEIGPRGFVEFVAAEGGLYDLDSWKGPSFRERVERSELPPKIGLAAGPLVRDDLLGLDLRSRQFVTKVGDEAGLRLPMDWRGR